MFGFGKKKMKEDKAPEMRLAEFQRKNDWAEVSRTYYELGVTAMDAGDLHKAQLWLHRAVTIYSADDNIYGGGETVGRLLRPYGAAGG